MRGRIVFTSPHSMLRSQLRCRVFLVAGLLLIGQESWPGNVSKEAGSGPTSVGAAEGSFSRALSLIRAGQFIPSLRLLRRALVYSRRGPDAWRVRVVYAEALNSAAFQTIDRLGVPGPQQSISTQRIAFLRQASAQLDTAVAQLRAVAAKVGCRIVLDHA